MGAHPKGLRLLFYFQRRSSYKSIKFMHTAIFYGRKAAYVKQPAKNSPNGATPFEDI